jgi:hypothetical protein
MKSMKHLRLYEEYDMNLDTGDLGKEYAKAIISKYIDDLEKGKTLQDSFDFYCEKLDESLRSIVFYAIHQFTDIISDNIRLLGYTDKYYMRKNAEKYNL